MCASFHGFRLLTPARPFTLLGGYRLTAIRLNLFHHKRLNKEVHSSGPATAAQPSLASFRSVGCPYRTLSTTYDHPSRSPPFLKRKVRGCEIATRGTIVRWIFPRYNCSCYADKSSIILSEDLWCRDLIGVVRIERCREI